MKKQGDIAGSAIIRLVVELIVLNYDHSVNKIAHKSTTTNELLKSSSQVAECDQPKKC